MPDLGQINVNIGADTKRLEQGLNKSKSELKDFEGKVSMGAGKLALFTGAAIAGAAALRGLGQFLVSSIKLSADLAETQSKFATVFDQSSKKVDALASSFGILSKGEAQGFLATTGAILRGAGLAGDQVDNLASQVGELARDFSSFNNVPVAETFTAINAAITGEREQLKRLGIVLREADVQQRALEQSGKDSAKALTQQEKAVATLALITEQATVQVGDYARTSGSAANQGKQLETNVKNLQEAFAEGLEPALRESLTLINQFASSKGLVSGIKQIGDVVGDMGTGIILAFQGVPAVINYFKEALAQAYPFLRTTQVTVEAIVAALYSLPGVGDILTAGAIQNAQNAADDFRRKTSPLTSRQTSAANLVAGTNPISTSGGSSGGSIAVEDEILNRKQERVRLQNKLNEGLQRQLDLLKQSLVPTQQINTNVSRTVEKVNEVAGSVEQYRVNIDGVNEAIRAGLDDIDMLSIHWGEISQTVSGALAGGLTDVFAIMTDGATSMEERLNAVGASIKRVLVDLGRALLEAQLLNVLTKSAVNPLALGGGLGLLLFGGLLGGRRSTPRVNTSLGRPAPQPSSQLVASVGIDQIHFALERYKSENFLA